MVVSFNAYTFFTLWITLAVCAMALNLLNIDWQTTTLMRGVTIVLILGIIQGSVLEFPLIALCTIIFWEDEKQDNKLPADHLTLVLNYNLLAMRKDDIDECLQKMYDAYMGNLSHNICAVLVSATKSDDLRQYELEVRDNYRAMICDHLYTEGVMFANNMKYRVHALRLKSIWSLFDGIDQELFVKHYLPKVCSQFSRGFMVIHRVSRVLRKCGQYQDLMLLSQGDDKAYTYTDKQMYSKYARHYGESLFYDSEDVNNINGRQFDYTLVLDSDTGLLSGSAVKLLEIAAANPDRGIIQPAIKLDCTGSDTIFMHIERIRQSIYEPMTNTLNAIMGQSSYFGKALIKNSVYIENVIGTRDNLIERVPVDVLSHDTFEAALLKPLYAGSVYLLEAPSYNYVAWNIRERRWNRGEVLLSMYFWKNAIGKPMRWLQSKLQGDKFNATKLRTESKLDFVTSYIAHSALRQMFMKPLLLAYIIIHYHTNLRYRYASVIVVMFLILVFPKFATITRENYKLVLIETFASILQFTPEAVVGCVRIVRVLQANICANVTWIPQRVVEMEFKSSNPFLSAWKHLWIYSAVSIICAMLLCLLFADGLYVLFMLGTLFLLPFYTGFTSLTINLSSTRRASLHEDEEASIGLHVPTETTKTADQYERKAMFKCLHAFGVCFLLDDEYIRNIRHITERKQ